MTCVSCGSRKGRRECPALGGSICTVCCGTKRLVEIRCPDNCVYLASAREHPAAAVRRQQAQDLAVILPGLRQFTERQHQLFFLFHTLIARHTPDGFARLVDEDVAAAAAALAATLETAARGVIYDQTPDAHTARQLWTELKTLLSQMREQGTTVYDREAAMVLRAIEQGARTTRDATGGTDIAYLEVMARLLQVNRTQPPAGAAGTGSSIILP